MSDRFDYILGLDLGTNSIGWAIVERLGGAPARLGRAGVRVFEAGLEGDIAGGRAESRNLKRRQARQVRRQLDRRRRRMARLLHLLQGSGLLPAGDAGQILPALDRELLRVHSEQLAEGRPRHHLAHVLPYYLRTRGLDHRLEPHELGRALYHLAQRRGFLSNRRSVRKDDEEEGAVRAEITRLQEALRSSGARTVGEYFAGIEPEVERIRCRKTSREMYAAEFDLIWLSQARHHPEHLSEGLRSAIHRAIFYQRPLKSVAHLIGRCELEPGRRRSPQALLDAQRFRLLQMVNNTKIIDVGTGEEMAVGGEGRARLLDVLDREGDLTFAKAKKLLGFKPGQAVFNLENGDEKRFVGNRTNAKLAKVFGSRWWKLARDERDAVVTDLLSIEREEALARRGVDRWGLDSSAARQFAGIKLEDGYAGLSRRAIGRLLPYLEQGTAYSSAVLEEYGEFHRKSEPLEALPSIEKAMPSLRNPVVARVLTELRKVVNGIVREHGKPALIRLELAREIKQSRRVRQDVTRRNRANEELRRRAAERILKEAGIANPSPGDLQKVLLADECGWHCPYTNHGISMRGLFGPNPEFDVEHIIPFSRSFDDSFRNKTLCWHEENRRVKKNLTPFEAYRHDPAKYEEVLQRVRSFQGDAARDKLARFMLERTEDLDEFASRQLNDTRYATRLAADYLGLLFGGRSDQGGSLRVQATTGQLTAFLRSGWRLNGILSAGEYKSRDDHRHHAVDAVTIALTDAATIKALGDAAEKSHEERGRLFARLDDPWPGFRDGIAEVIHGISVSHRPNRHVSGALHEETNYSSPKVDARGRECVHVRKPLARLSLKEIAAIVDDRVRDTVQAQLERIGGDPKKFEIEANLPALVTRDGRRILVRKARIRVPQRARAIGKGATTRWVLPDTNHHIEIIARLDGKGQELAWQGRVVSHLEAARRLGAGRPVVEHATPEGWVFLFSLCKGDTVRMGPPDHSGEVFRVNKFSLKGDGSIKLVFMPSADARQVSKVSEAGRSRSPETLRLANAAKVQVTPLGVVRWARD